MCDILGAASAGNHVVRQICEMTVPDAGPLLDSFDEEMYAYGKELWIYLLLCKLQWAVALAIMTHLQIPTTRRLPQRSVVLPAGLRAASACCPGGAVALPVCWTHQGAALRHHSPAGPSEEPRCDVHSRAADGEQQDRRQAAVGAIRLCCVATAWHCVKVDVPCATCQDGLRASASVCIKS